MSDDHRHTIIYFASDEGSRIKPFQPFQGSGHYGRVSKVSRLTEDVYELSFYSELSGDDVLTDLRELGVFVLLQTIDGHVEFRHEDLDQHLDPEQKNRLAAE